MNDKRPAIPYKTDCLKAKNKNMQLVKIRMIEKKIIKGKKRWFLSWVKNSTDLDWV